VALCVILATSCTMATEVNLRVFGSQDNNPVITICPNDKFLLVAECAIMESRTLTWSLRPLLSSPVVITILDSLGENRQGSVNFVLTKKSSGSHCQWKFLYITSTCTHRCLRESIENHAEFLIRCEAETSTEYSLVTLKFAAGVATVITSGNRTANILSISWSANITNIVYIAVLATNTMNGVESSTVVGGVERKASLPVDFSDPYNVIVIVFDQCQQNFTSEVFTIEGLPVNDSTPTVELSTTSSMNSSSNMPLACSPPPKQPCTIEVQNEGLLALSVILAIVVVLLLFLLIVLLIFPRRRQVKKYIIKGTTRMHAFNVKTDQL
jgi:hypothetical protein